MVLQKHTARIRLAVLAIPLMALVWVAVSTLAWGHATQGSVQAQEEPTGGMALSASGTDVTCDAGKCDVPAGSDFTLSIVTADAPAGGYLGMQTQIYFGGLTYNESADAADEILWPDNILPVRSAWLSWVGHGGASDIARPFDDISNYQGTLVQLSMTCSSEIAEFPVVLLGFEGNPQGSVYSVIGEAGTETIIVPVTVTGELLEAELEGTSVRGPFTIADSLTINCGAEEEEEEEEPTPTEEEPEPTSTEEPPSDLPGTGSGSGANGGGAAGLWAMIAVLLVAGAGLGVAGWKYARGPQAS